MTVQARLKVHSVTDFGTHQAVTATAVYSADPTDPNYSYSQASPHAHLEMTVSNPAAFGAFVPQGVYDLTFQPVVPRQPQADAVAQSGQQQPNTDPASQAQAQQADPIPSPSSEAQVPQTDPSPAISTVAAS